MAEVASAFVSLMPSAKGFGAKLDKEVGGDIDRTGKGLGSKLGTAMKAGALGVLAGGALLTGFLKDAASEASDLGESVNAVGVTFGKNAAGIKALGMEAADAVGLSRTEFNALSVQFSAFATTVAGKGGNVVKTMDELTTRGADFASVMNLDVNEAMTLFQSGLAGETEPLRKYGIDLSAASVQAYAYANGIAKSGQELTEAQKVQARYGSLMEQTRKTQGDFTNTSDSLANVMRRLGAHFDNSQAKLGKAFLPALEKVGKFLINEGIPALNRFGQWFTTEGVPALQGFAGALGSVWNVLQPVLSFIADNIASVGAFVGVIATVIGVTKAWAAAQMLLSAVMTANPIGVVVVALAALAAGLVYAYKHSETFRKITDAAFKAVGAAGKWLWNNALQPVFKFIVNGIGWLMDGWAKLLGALGKVPGFGWAKEASRVMAAAADKAHAMADGINQIPTTKKIDITVETHYVGKQYAFSGAGGHTVEELDGARAHGGPVNRGGTYLVGENGPELFTPSRSGAIVPNGQTRAIAGGHSGPLFNIERVEAQDVNHFLRQMQQRQVGAAGGGVNF